MASVQSAELRFLGLPKVLDRVDMSRSSWYEMVKSGEAPKPCKVGRKSRWVESEIDTWMKERMQQRFTPTPDDDDEL